MVDGEKKYKYRCGHSCPFWDSGQGYDYSSCHVPDCVEWDCFHKRNYIFQPMDVTNQFSNMFIDADCIISLQPKLLIYRDFLLDKFVEMNKKGINQWNRKEIEKMIHFLETASIGINDQLQIFL